MPELDVGPLPKLGGGGKRLGLAANGVGDWGVPRLMGIRWLELGWVENGLGLGLAGVEVPKARTTGMEMA